MVFGKKKQLTFENTFEDSPEKVWQAWTDPSIVKQWWGPKGVTVPECEIEPHIGGRIYIVMEAGESMGKYQGTRWPLDGTFTDIKENEMFAYTAQSWTEGEKEKSTIDQSAVLTLTSIEGKTKMKLVVTLDKVGPGAKMAAFGMKYGYKAQFKKLAELLDK